MKEIRVQKKWGDFRRFTLNEKSTVKMLTVKSGKRFSLQKHKNRGEFWYFLDNNAKVSIGKKNYHAKKGSSFFVPKKTIHRIEALKRDVRILEISFGDFDENDIVRLEDDFGRAK